MKIIRAISLVLVMVLMLGVFSVDAAFPSANTANLPWTKEVVDSKTGGGVGQYVSIAHHPRTGAAFMSYYDAKNGDLIMAHEVTPGTGNCPESPDWVCEIIASDGDVGKFSSIDVAWFDLPLFEGITKIGISFYDETNGSLKYAQNTLKGWTIQEVDDHPSSGSRGKYSSLKFTSDGRTIIAYHVVSNLLSIGGVKIASYNPDGTGTGCDGGDSDYWDCSIIDSVIGKTDYGIHVSLDIDYEDRRQVAFYDSDRSELIWAQYWGYGGSCSNPEWNCVTVDGQGDVGKFVSLHASDSSSDRMRLAYYDGTTGTVKYAV